MIIYEKSTTKEEIVEGKAEMVKSYDAVEKEEEAEYIHICGHDKNPPEPCRRVKIKK